MFGTQPQQSNLSQGMSRNHVGTVSGDFGGTTFFEPSPNVCRLKLLGHEKEESEEATKGRSRAQQLAQKLVQKLLEHRVRLEPRGMQRTLRRAP